MPSAAPQMKSPDSSLFPADMLDVTYLCQVCKEVARGYHFGAFTCEGCKSFFGRTCKPVDKNERSSGDASSFLEPRVKLHCKANRSCNVEGKNRTSCKYCRYEKCLRVGMSPQNSRYGRRSKYFKVATALDAHRRAAESSFQAIARGLVDFSVKSLIGDESARNPFGASQPAPLPLRSPPSSPSFPSTSSSEGDENEPLDLRVKRRR
ncbi:hypothetical protein QR680_008538 [Steinernema hermaphroditum]|uniref:Nuclear receptor domain-containing protein n=1 Tax=Steinernema hermaphroditum TaxID=289476 RepID=A0AA39M883_9BILA|nr:hypothetical protein QR680_008538 [Steinernema hermaphroditum]